MKRRIVNTRAQPVELHLSSGVRVIEPLGETALDEDELDSRHVRMLADQRLITVPGSAEAIDTTAATVAAPDEVMPTRAHRRTSRARRSRKPASSGAADQPGSDQPGSGPRRPARRRSAAKKKAPERSE